MSVTIDQLSTADGRFIGILTLDSSKSLNALSLTMVQALDLQLRQWQADPRIVCVLLRGAGDKAFCAGGDVRAVVEQQRVQPGQLHPLGRDFFAHEYRLDYLIHHYPKPLIVWAHGHVMGGGMGLMQGASIRIVTPCSQLCMPEISIGLYPDAGGSWFLNQLPKPLGLFFGLTGSRINASDAINYQLADHLLLQEQQEEFLSKLSQLNWQDNHQAQIHTLLKNLATHAAPETPKNQWPELQERLGALMQATDLPSIYHALCRLSEDPNPLLANAGKTLASGSPMSAWLVWQQLKRSEHLSLGQCLQMEYSISLHCCINRDFIEGVRAKLIDKDNRPNWQWSELEQVPATAVEAHFKSFSQHSHPLSDLA